MTLEHSQGHSNYLHKGISKIYIAAPRIQLQILSDLLPICSGRFKDARLHERDHTCRDEDSAMRPLASRRH